MTEIGPHLLGRKPSPPDLRDYRLANFRGIGEQEANYDPRAEIALAVKELQATTVTYQRWAATKYEDVTRTHWWQAFNHLANAAGQTPPFPTLDKVWDASFQLDQGNTRHCVGFGWAGWGNTLPFDDNWVDADGHKLYYECKAIEGDPIGEGGAYTRDGAKAMFDRRRLAVYAFATTIDEILTHLRSNGPVVIGTDWTDDMFSPDANGFVKPTGPVAGGHCYLLYGVEGSTLIFKNSWGDWGDNGSFRMYIADFQVLLDAYGEAIASVELPL
jgi:hypothetical protein